MDAAQFFGSVDQTARMMSEAILVRSAVRQEPTLGRQVRNRRFRPRLFENALIC